MLRIPTPTLGILDLSQGRDAAIAASDRDLLQPIFDNVVESTFQVPKCDVLFLYCALTEDGRIVGTDARVPAILSKSGALIVVFASENSGSAYMSATSDQFGQSLVAQNLVATLNRRGDAFGRFFHRLFSLMSEGKSMPMAWVKVAPQGGSIQERSDNPDTVFIAGAGQVGFEKRSKPGGGPASVSAVRSLLSRFIRR